MRTVAMVLMVLTGCTTVADQCLATCKGCCTTEGTCRGGTTNDECGTAGSECLACGARTCQLGICRSSGATGGGTGGGSTGGGAGGGMTGGGGGTTGGGGGTTGGGGGTVDAGPGLRVFVTSSAWTGNLAGAAGLADGFAAGDALCAAAAADAGLDRTWIAYLDGDNLRLEDRLPPGRWRVVSSMSVVEHDDAGLRLTGHLDRTERGAVVPLDAGVWTGVRRTEDNLGLDCAGWSAGTPAATGTMGTTNEEQWNSLGLRSCASLGRLFCFQL